MAALAFRLIEVKAAKKSKEELLQIKGVILGDLQQRAKELANVSLYDSSSRFVPSRMAY